MTVDKVSLVERVTEMLRDYIDNGTLEIGDRLPSEAALCEKYDVSRTTIRESFRLLQAIGYVRSIPNRGMFVADKNRSGIQNMGTWLFDHAQEVLDAFELRQALEPEVAAMAAIRANDEERLMIMGVYTMFKRETAKKNLASMVIYDEQFHSVIAQATHNQLLIQVNKLISDTIRSYRSRSFSKDSDAHDAVEHHRQIANAIMEGDADTARRVMVEHLQRNIIMIKDLQEELQKNA